MMTNNEEAAVDEAAASGGGGGGGGEGGVEVDFLSEEVCCLRLRLYQHTHTLPY